MIAEGDAKIKFLCSEIKLYFNTVDFPVPFLYLPYNGEAEKPWQTLCERTPKEFSLLLFTEICCKSLGQLPRTFVDSQLLGYFWSTLRVAGVLWVPENPGRWQ